MLKWYKVNWRFVYMALSSVFSNRLYLFVNVLGMVLGYTSVFLIGLYLSDELNYDRFHKESENIYRVVQYGDYGGIVEKSSSCPFPLGPALAQDYPNQISAVARLYNYQSPSTQISYRNVVHNDSGFFYVDPAFFEVFTVDTLKTKVRALLTEPYTAVISQSAALKYFGYGDVLGKKLTIENQVQVEIVAVVKDWPRHSHFHFSLLVSMSTLEQIWGRQLPDGWVTNPCWTYVKLKNPAIRANLEAGLPEFVNRNFSSAVRANNSLYLQALHDIHHSSDLEYEIEANGSIAYIYVFGSIVFFLMLMATINYVNLTTASFASRAREIAVKKVLGATAFVVRRQLILEAMLISVLSIIVSLVFTELLLPWFNGVTLKQFVLADLFTLRNVLYVFGLVLVVSIIGGLYPALFISGLHPSRILRGNLKRALKSGTSRKVLVVSQLFISTMLIFAAFTINRQYQFMMASDNGLNRESILVIQSRFTGLYKYYSKFKQDVERSNSVESVTASDYIPGIGHNRHPFVLHRNTPAEELVFFPALQVMSDFSKTYQLNFIAGRAFAKDTFDVQSSVIINNEMVEYLGFESAQEALGKSVNTFRGSEKVVGVFSGFYPRTLQRKPEPFIIDMGSDDNESLYGKQYVAVRYRKGQKEQALTIVNSYLKKYIDKKQVRIRAYSDIYREQYVDESLFNLIAGVMSLLSLAISAVGLLGLISFLITQKSREISIRKVYGATNRSVLGLIISEFLRIYLFVIILTLPAAWYLSDLWLSNFAVNVSFSIVDFIFSVTLIALMIFGVAVFRLREAANVNPAEILKYE